MEHVDRLIMFVLLLLVQMLVLNHVCLFQVATPLLYVFFAITFRRGTPMWMILLWNFSLGLMIDIVSNTPGLAAGCMTLVGFIQPYLLEPLTKVLISLGMKRGMVVYGQDCLDEISISAPTSVCEFRDGWYKTYEIRPEDFGFTRGKKSDIVGGTPEENAAVARDILANKKGPKYDVVMLNAGAAIYIGGKADSLSEGIARAKELVANGAAKKKLDEFIALSNQ